MDIKDQVNDGLVNLAKKGEIISCNECGADYWHPIFVLVKIDKLESKLSKDKIIPLQAFKCANCGNINRDFDPLTDNK